MMTENNELLDKKLQEFQTWAIGSGKYAISTTNRQIRRIRYFSKRIDVFNVKLNEIYKYVNEELSRGKKKKTLSNEMKDLQAWCNFLNLNINLPKFKREPAPEPWIPSDDLILDILNYCNRMPNKGIWLRNKVIVEILAFGGLRIGELIRLNVEDIRSDGIYVRSEKGEKDRLIGLPDEVLKEIHTYIDLYRIKSDQRALFTTPRGRMDYDYTRKVIKDIGRAVGAPQLHPHSFRHYCATSLLKGFYGAPPLDLREVQIHLSHARIETTVLYTHISQKEVVDHVRDRYNTLFRNDTQETEHGSKINESGHGFYGGTGI